MNCRKVDLTGKKQFDIIKDGVTASYIAAWGSLDEHGIDFKRTEGTMFNKLGKFYYREYESYVVIGDNVVTTENAKQSETIKNFINDLICFELIKERE